MAEPFAAVRSYYDSLPATPRAMALVLVATFAFSAMHAAVRYITADVHPFEVAFFRNLFGAIVVIPWFVRLGLAPLRTRRRKLHALRALIQVVSMLAFFTALKLAELAEVSALSFTAPLFASLAAVLVLGERLRLRRWSALIVGFLGALVILRPGVEALNPGALLALSASAMWAAALVIIKMLSRTDSSVTITAYMVLFLTPLSFVPALVVWQWPTWEQLAILVAIGIMGNLGHLAMAQAFRDADATLVLPLDFTRLIWASLFGFMLFAEIPDLWTWIGGAIIFASTTYIAVRESRIKRGPGAGPTSGPAAVG